MGWAQEEFRTLDLGDERLNARAVLLAERLGSKPTESIANACRGWAETQAAYRFLSNARTDWQGLLEPHWPSSLARMRAHAVVLNIQESQRWIEGYERVAEGARAMASPVPRPCGWACER